MSDRDIDRWEVFSDKELRTLHESLVAGLKDPHADVADFYAHALIAEITVVASSRGDDRCRLILEPREPAGRIGRVACWKPLPSGGNCRMPKGHEGPCPGSAV